MTWLTPMSQFLTITWTAIALLPMWHNQGTMPSKLFASQINKITFLSSAMAIIFRVLWPWILLDKILLLVGPSFHCCTQDILKYQFALQWSIVCLIVILNFYFSKLTILHDKQRLDTGSRKMANFNIKEITENGGSIAVDNVVKQRSSFALGII